MAGTAKKIGIIFFSLITLSGLTLKISDRGFFFCEPRSFFLLPLLVLVAYGLNSISNTLDKRKVVCSFVPACILSLCDLLGSILIKKGTALWLLKDVETLLLGILKFVGCGIVLFVSIYFLNSLLSATSRKESARNYDRYESKRSFFIIWLLLILAWLPCYLNQYPAVMTADSTDQIGMVLGIYPLSNHHPYFHTLLLKSAVAFSKLLFRPSSPDEIINQKAIAMFTAFQLLLMTAVFAIVFCIIVKKTRNFAFKAAVLAFFLLYPVHAFYSVTIWKDVPFSVCFLALLVLLLCELEDHKRYYCILIGAAGILLTLFRHNGFYIILLTIPFLPLAFSHHAKPVVCVFLAVLFVYILWSQVIIPALDILPGRISEAFSIPLQQIALTGKRQNQKMDEDLLEDLQYYFDIPEIWRNYSPRISDPVKNNFAEEKYKIDPVRFWKFWLRLGITYPQDFIDAFLIHTYGYWYPETPHWVFVTGIDDDGLFGIHSDPKIDNKTVDRVLNWLSESKYDDYPLLSLFFSPGACFWMILITFFLLIYKRSPAFILCVPVFILWLTALASPVNCEFRYVYGMFLCLPIIFCTVL